MIFKYIGKLFDRASKGSILLTDRLTILLVPFSTLALWLMGVEMTDSLQETILVGVAMTVGAVVILRLIAASYFVWKDDQKHISGLKHDLAKPERVEKAAMDAYVLTIRQKLCDGLAKLTVMTEYLAVHQHIGTLKPDFEKEFVHYLEECRIGINQLSYDAVLRSMCHKYLVLLTGFLNEAMTGKDVEGRISKIYASKKIVFRMLHRRDIDPKVGVIAMLELDNSLEGVEPDFTNSSAKIAEAEALMGEIKKMLTDYPELSTMIRDGNLPDSD